jgi:AraC family ethanolamine operon transcriptional activator
MPKKDARVIPPRLSTVRQPSGSPVSQLSSDDPKEFAAALTGYDSRYLPTTEDHLFTKVELLLPSGRLVIVRRPPMTFEGIVSANEGLVAFLLEENPRAKINGRLMKAHNITVWKKGTHYRGYEELPLTHCSFLLFDTLCERNWPEAMEGSFFTAPRSSFSLRSRIRDIARIIKGDPTRLMNPNVIEGIDQSVTSGIDAALMAAAEVNSSVATVRHVLLCKRAEEYLKECRYQVCSGVGVAKACGVSLRTLHSALISVLGMSLNRYLLLHRLWLTRYALLQADDDKFVKTIALNHGFWHLGYFSRAYYLRFGELPSATLANRRSKSGRSRSISRP